MIKSRNRDSVREVAVPWLRPKKPYKHDAYKLVLFYRNCAEKSD